MKLSTKLQEKMHPRMKAEQITVNDENDLKNVKDGRPINSALNSYPLIDKKGNVRLLPIAMCNEILLAVDQVDEAKARREFDKNEPTASSGNSRYALDGWRVLQDAEYEQWKDGTPSRLEVMGETGITQAAFDSEVNARVEAAKSEILSEKDKEIEKMKAEIAALKEKKGGKNE